MRRQPKDTTVTDQFLWPDLPGANERLLAGEIPHTNAHDLKSRRSKDCQPMRNSVALMASSQA